MRRTFTDEASQQAIQDVLDTYLNIRYVGEIASVTWYYNEQEIQAYACGVMFPKRQDMQDVAITAEDRENWV